MAAPLHLLERLALRAEGPRQREITANHRNGTARSTVRGAMTHVLWTGIVERLWNRQRTFRQWFATGFLTQQRV